MQNMAGWEGHTCREATKGEKTSQFLPPHKVICNTGRYEYEDEYNRNDLKLISHRTCYRLKPSPQQQLAEQPERKVNGY